MGGRWKAPCQSSGRAGEKASAGEGGRTAFPGEGAAVVAASLAALPGGICRDGVGGRRARLCTTDPLASGGSGGRGSSPSRSSPVPHTHTHSAAAGRARRRLCLAGAPSGGLRASGGEEVGSCGGLRVRVCRGLRGRRAGGAGPAAPAARRRGEPAVCQWLGGLRGAAAGPPRLSPGLREASQSRRCWRSGGGTGVREGAWRRGAGQVVTGVGGGRPARAPQRAEAGRALGSGEGSGRPPAAAGAGAPVQCAAGLGARRGRGAAGGSGPANAAPQRAALPLCSLRT